MSTTTAPRKSKSEKPRLWTRLDEKDALAFKIVADEQHDKPAAALRKLILNNLPKEAQEKAAKILALAKQRRAARHGKARKTAPAK